MSDYYSGYYWGINPFDSSDLQGRIIDTDLKNKVIERIRKIDKIRIKSMMVSVNYTIVTLGGTVETFRERRIIGEEIWKISGVTKLLNLLKVSNPMTAGPRIINAGTSDVYSENRGHRYV
jgi:osmotically-inducible protein OsmY